MPNPPGVELPFPREYLPHTPYEHGASMGVAKNHNHVRRVYVSSSRPKGAGVGRGRRGRWLDTKRLEKSETGAGSWTRSHACCFARPLPLLEGAGSEFSMEDPITGGSMDRAEQAAHDWGRSEFKREGPMGRMDVKDGSQRSNPHE
jgi:hypothetical protein